MINSDESIKNLKGPSRPIFKIKERLYMIASLERVDFVMSFSEKRISTYLEELSPHYWIKSSDYNIETIHPGERAIAEKNNTEIIFLPTIFNYSTTEILESLRKEQN